MIRAWLDAGTITAAGGALAAVLTAVARLLRALRERDRCPCGCAGCDCRAEDEPAGVRGEEGVPHG